jgi:hypothetical protein
VLQTLRSGQALEWIPLQHVEHQVGSILTSVGNQGFERGLSEIGEGLADLACEAVAVGPLFLVRSAHDSAYFVDLVTFGCAWEKRAQRLELSHDAPHGEDIDGRVVGGRAQQHFGCSLPPRANLVCLWRPRPYFSG